MENIRILTKEFIKTVVCTFLDSIPEEYLEDILTETFGEVNKKYYRCVVCGKIKHESKFTKRSLISDKTMNKCLCCFNDENNKTKVMYSVYKDQLTVDDNPIEDDAGYLLIKCKHCSKMFYSIRMEVTNRIKALNSDDGSESNFYCSDECRDACPLYRSKGAQQVTQRDNVYIKQANILALERANYKCEICGDVDNLEVHHIIPFKVSPIEGYDLDNLIVLCEKHHKEYGHYANGCKLSDLRVC